MIDGIVMKALKTHEDERGFFREIFRFSEELNDVSVGQLSHSLVKEGVIKAWHGHEIQTQWTYVACGVLKVAIHDCRPDSPTYRETMELLMGDNQSGIVYCLPPGVVHGYRCISGPAHVFYVTSGVYDPDDEVRIPHDDPTIGYDWIAGPATK